MRRQLSRSGRGRPDGTSCIDRLQLDAQVKADTGIGSAQREPRRTVGREEPGEQPRRRLQHVHRCAQLACGRSQLEAKKAAADHHHPGVRSQRRAQAARIAQVSHIVDSGELPSKAGEQAGAAAGCQETAVEMQGAAVAEDDLAMHQVDLDDLNIGSPIDAVLLIDAGGKYAQRRLLRCAQDVLRQRRSFVRQVRLPANQDDGSDVAALAQGISRNRARLSSADDDDGALSGRARYRVRGGCLLAHAVSRGESRPASLRRPL